MPLSSELPPSFGIPRLITRAVIQFMLGGILLIALITFTLLSSHLAGITQLLFRDSALHFANQIVVREEAGLDELTALTETEHEARFVIPTARLVLVKSSGEVATASADCSLKMQRLERFPWAAFTAPELPWLPLSVSSPCAQPLPFLSSAILKRPDGDAALLLYANAGLQSYLHSSAGLRLLVIYSLPSLAFNLTALLGTLVALRVLFFRYVDRAAIEVRQFSAGDRRVRLAPTPLDDLNELLSAFNLLADEESRRLDELAAEDETRRRMLAELIHDLKTPLTAIEAAAERLANARDEQQRSRYQSVIESSLITQSNYAIMLDQLGSLPLDSFALEREQVNLNQLSSALYSQLLPNAETKRIDLRLQYDHAGDIAILGHPGLLQRAIQNVLSNALRYTPEGGKVSFTLIQQQGSALITITDSGPGIGVEELPFVQQEFYRGKSAAETKGSGLGLAIVNRIMHLHGGSVQIESTIGVGTAVTLSLPLVHDLPPTAPQTRSDRSSSDSSAAPANRFFPITSAGIAVLTSIGALLLEVVAGEPWVVRVLAAAMLFGIGMRIYSAKQRLKLLQSDLGLEILIALSLLVVIEARPVPSIFIGLAYSTLSIFLTATFWRSQRMIAAIGCFIAFLLALNLAPTAKQFNVGAISGLVISLLAVVLEQIRLNSRLASIVFRATWLLGLTSGVLLAISIYFFVPAVLRTVFAADAERTSEHIVTLAADSTLSPSQLDAELSDLQLRNPKVELALFNRDGSYRSETRFTGWAPKALPSPLLKQIEERSPVQVESPFVSKSFLLLRSLGTATTDPISAVQYPSWLADHFASKRAAYFLTQYILTQMLLVGCLLLVIAIPVTRVVKHTFQTIYQGIERFRQGNYSQPIGIRSDDALGALVTELDELAQRLPVLAGQLRQRATVVKSFLLRCSQDLRETGSQIDAYLNSSRLDAKFTNATPLIAAAATQRVVLENLLELFQLEFDPVRRKSESVPLAEILDEELANAKDRAIARRQLLTFDPPIGLRSLQGDPEVCVEALKHLLALASTSAPVGAQLTVRILNTSEQVEIRIEFPTLTLDPMAVKFLEDPFQSPLGLDGNAMPFGGYQTVRLIRQFQRLGWQLDLSADSDSGSVARMCFPTGGEAAERSG